MLDRILNVMLYLGKWVLLALGLVVLASACFGFWCGIRTATRERDYADSDDTDKAEDPTDSMAG